MNEIFGLRCWNSSRENIHVRIDHVTIGVRILKIGKAYIFFRLLDASFDLILVLKKLFVLS